MSLPTLFELSISFSTKPEHIYGKYSPNSGKPVEFHGKIIDLSHKISYIPIEPVKNEDS